MCFRCWFIAGNYGFGPLHFLCGLISSWKSEHGTDMQGEIFTCAPCWPSSASIDVSRNCTTGFDKNRAKLTENTFESPTVNRRLVHLPGKAMHHSSQLSLSPCHQGITDPIAFPSGLQPPHRVTEASCQPALFTTAVSHSALPPDRCRKPIRPSPSLLLPLSLPSLCKGMSPLEL